MYVHILVYKVQNSLLQVCNAAASAHVTLISAVV